MSNAAFIDESHPLYREPAPDAPDAATVTARAAAVCDCLWQFGPPSEFGIDEESARWVATCLASSVPRLIEVVGCDEARRDEAKAAVRAFVAARSREAYDREQADRICRAVHRGWMVAMIRRHPRADRFHGLTSALLRGRFTKAQIELAKRLVDEVQGPRSAATV